MLLGRLQLLFKALSEAGDEFITFAPYFPEYKCFVESTGASLKVVPAKIDDFQIQFDKFEEMITAKTKAIIVNSPNNPSGVVYSEETIKKLAEVLTAKSKEYNHPIFLISGEPYREIAYGVDVPYLPKYYDNTIVIPAENERDLLVYVALISGQKLTITLTGAYSGGSYDGTYQVSSYPASVNIDEAEAPVTSGYVTLASDNDGNVLISFDLMVSVTSDKTFTLKADNVVGLQ